MRAILQILIEIIVSASIYLVLFYLNQTITAPLEHTRGINWIFLPAGVRIFIALILGFWGAIGLAIASLIINYFGFFEYDLITNIGIAIICGLAPLLGRFFVIHNLRVLPDLSNLSYQQILVSIVTFSLLSSGLHQAWFVTRGLISGSWNHFYVMFIGDVVGSILFVFIIKYIVAMYSQKINGENLAE